MQLISLTANQSSFRPVIFKNKSGLNFIVANQSELSKEDKGKTVNGVGKSLLIAIIHFCLGSSSKNSFKKSLPNWVFTLTFEVNRSEYTAIRSTDKQNVIVLNGEETPITHFNKKFGNLLFDSTNIGELSFRGLLPFFIRPRRGSYISFNNPNTSKKDYQILATNAFLLGLDVLLVEEKFKLKKEKERIKNLINELKNDSLLKDFFTGNQDVSLEEQELGERISDLEKDLSAFQVADDYYEIKTKADELKRKIDKGQNQIVLLQNQVVNIEESRKVNPDIKKESIERIYREASVVLPANTLKQLSELEKFYLHLTSSREKRLLDQKNEIIREIDHLYKEVDSLKREFDSNLKYLNAHQALDVFVKLTNKLSDLKAERDSLKRYNELIKEYHKAKNKVDKEFIEASEKTDIYITDASEVIKSLKDFFRELAKRFYPTATAGITVVNNDADNQIRFDFDAKIQADSSDGINSVKIFCYDLTILLRGHGHRMNLIFHDSRLLDGVDPRQVAELFRILRDYVSGSNKQYILTVNQNQLDEMKQYLDPNEYDSIISQNITHQLKDDSPANKLLGIQVDMAYE